MTEKNIFIYFILQINEIKSLILDHMSHINIKVLEVIDAQIFNFENYI